MAAGENGAAAFARDQHGEILVVVLVAIADAAAVDDHAVVEQGPVAFANGFQLLKNVGELLGVKAIDGADLGELAGVVLMM